MVDKGFFEEIKPVKIDFTPMGFHVASNLKVQPGGGCGGCGGDTSCG
ncbi:MAG: hypothetical protein ACLFOY_17045 [Desulfatibacillaceae bacterium]